MMKKVPYQMLPFYVAGVLMMGISAYSVSLLFDAVPQLADLHWLVQLIPALLFMLGALAAHLLSKRKAWAYILGYALNAIGSGWTIGVLMGVREILPTQGLFLVLLPAIVLGVVYCVLVGILDGEKTTTVSLVFVILSVVLLLAGIAVWIWLFPLMGCAFVFSALFLLPFPIGVGVAMGEPQEMFRYLSFTGFGAFILILLVAVFILSEGELLEGLDGIDFGGGKKAKAKRAK